MTVNTLWYVGRGSGLVDLILLTAVLVLGIANRSGRPTAGLPRFAVAVVHRNTSLLALVFLAIHVLTLWLDPFARLHMYDLVLPFAARYRPLWMGVGTVALDLMVALVVTSLLRHRMSLRSWRFIHWGAYVAWPLAVAHTLGTGTDNTSAWLLATTTVCVLAVAIAVVWRFSAGFLESAGMRTPPGDLARAGQPGSGPNTRGRHSAPADGRR
jgi:methionine sulfoxide reductase heme-binding subunit